jgi:hypothetical protein
MVQILMLITLTPITGQGTYDPSDEKIDIDVTDIAGIADIKYGDKPTCIIKLKSGGHIEVVETREQIAELRDRAVEKALDTLRRFGAL